MIPLDGDFHMIYYRTDVLEGSGLTAARRPGTTISPSPRRINGKDLNGDGTPDYGSCIAKKRNAQAYWFITSVAGGYHPDARAPARAPSSTPTT